MMQKYSINHLDCAACATKIENNVRKIEGVKYVNINFAGSVLSIDTDNMEPVIAMIKSIEPDVEISPLHTPKPNSGLNELQQHKTDILKNVAGFIFLAIGLVFRDIVEQSSLHWTEYLFYATAYLLVGWEVITGAIKGIVRGQVFDEKFLMTIATIGAFCIDQLPEAVAVMLFYNVGELLQDIAVNRSRRSIQSLLEIKPETANLLTKGVAVQVPPEKVTVGSIVLVKAGERIPLDGVVTDGHSFVDTSALTGESIPRSVQPDTTVMAGMINLSGTLKLKVTRTFEESSVSKILEMVENATARKAGTERFITTFARYYTPVVVIAAFLLATLPPLLISGQTFSDWVYRALVVLVISCPCALVISIPLGYFGGIGKASRKGILVKGSNFLDVLTQVDTVVFDKTGTLTKGEFKLTEIVPANGFDPQQLLEFAALAESQSNHPVALSVCEAYGATVNASRIQQLNEISGYGIEARVDGKEIIAGNDKLLHLKQIAHSTCEVEGTVVHIAVDRQYAGYLLISDSLKDDAAKAIRELQNRKIQTVMLTGDNQFAAAACAQKLNIERFYSGLLPEDKVAHLEQLSSEGRKIVFVGDGINDAPVIARADVGVAMGAFGSDAAIETADIVLMTDSPTKIAEAIDIAHSTRSIVWQNIAFAMGVKGLFIILGLFGIASMWEAVFGDMGVALLAVFNAMRIMRK